MNSQIKILLADESAVFLEQLRHVLERDPAFVIAGSANDAQHAVELLPGGGITSLACGRTPTNADCIAHLAGQLQSRHKAALPF